MSKLGLSLLITALMTHAAWAARDPFVGEWKLNASRTRLSDQMKVENVAGNKYAFDFGGNNPELITVDGKDQPGYGGTTLAVTPEGPGTWKVVRKKDGRTTISADWRLSRDGKTLTDDFTAIGADGSSSNVKYVYSRKAGTSGFAGTWETRSEKVTTVFEIKFAPYEVGGLSLTYSSGAIKNMKFDGKDYASVGPNATSGSTFSAKRKSEGELDLTDKYEGKVVATEVITLSSDLKTLVQTVQMTGKDSPNVLVYDRQ